jgi:RNA polymerase sigma factor (sigma-70 family)
VFEVELPAIDPPAVSDMAAAFADREAVDAAMQHLDADGRAIVVLHYFLGLPLTEVAATLRIPVGTVKSRLHRALGEMRIAVDLEPDPRAPVTGGQVA